MHGYKIPLKEMTKEERKIYLKELLDKKQENLNKQEEIIKNIEKELNRRKKKIAEERMKLLHYRHLIRKVI